MEDSDHHQRDLDHQEHGDDDDGHDGDPQGVSPPCLALLLVFVPGG